MSFDATSTAEEVTAGLDLRGETILITGCNSGLGLESTRVLASRGARIIGLARTVEKARAALDSVGAEGDAVACDLGDLASVRAAVETVRGLAPLDVILANAGIMALPTVQQIAGVERQLFVNHVGHFVLVTGLLDRLTDAGRVVMLSSGAHHYAERGIELDNAGGTTDYAPWRMYGRSKLANILFARSLSRRFAGSDRVAISLHPGVIQTNLGRHVPDAPAMYARLQHMMKTVPQGAATQCLAAVHPMAAEWDGQYLSDCAPKDTLPAGRDDALADALWAWSEDLVARL
jgi:NAD(P)-dependent dehydrogenase (short-subunit alcohol dehydrogenase family)